MPRTCTVPMVVVLLLAFLVAPVLADIIYLKDGRKFTGKVVSESGGVVKFKSVGGVLTFKKSEVDHIEKGLTKKDEYAARRKKIDDDDIPGLLALARWCEEERLVAQRRRIYRELTKKVPDHPQIRRAMGQIYSDGKWVKMPKDYTVPAVRSGERKEVKGASVVLPKDWKIATAGTKLTVTGPAPYATAPVLTVTFSEPIADPKVSFPEKEGWAKPVEVAAAGLKGLRGRRTIAAEGGVERAEILAVLTGPDRGMTVRLVTLVFEEKRNGAAMGLVLDSLKIKAPPSDYTNKHYKYCLNFPKGDGWTWEEDKAKDLFLGHQGGETEDWAQLWIVAGAAGKESEDVKTYANNLLAELKRSGDINKKGEITLGGEKAEFVDGTFLESGIPLRMRIAWLTHGKKTLLMFFKQHEFGVKRTNDCWDILVKTFRFLD